MKFFFCFCCLYCCWACGGQSNTPNTITVATAASTQYVLDELIKTFEQTSTIKVQKLVSSSGKLTAQIENGAPVDIFISADLKYPNYLEQKGLTIGKPLVYAHGQLALWTMSTTIDLEARADSLFSNTGLNKIAIADPKTAPYGGLSVDYLKTIGVYSKIQEKLVYGESIAQVNQYIMTQSVELGLTASSVVYAPQLKNKGSFVLIPKFSLAQGMVLLNEKLNSQAFYNFLQSERAKMILEDYGYQIK